MSTRPPKSGQATNASSKTPELPPQSALPSQEEAIKTAIGSRVRITTVAPAASTVEGTLYAADPSTSLLVLHISPAQNTSITQTSFHAPSGSYRIIPVSQISHFQIQALPAKSQTQQSQEGADQLTSSDSASNALPTALIQARLESALAASRLSQQKLGPKGTTPSDQALFDALSRTMPVVWSGNSMIVSDNFVVEKPYTAVNVRLVDGGRGDLERMRKVVDLERNKIALRNGGRIDGGIGIGIAGVGRKGG